MAQFEKVKFDTFIYKVLRQIHPDNGMSGDGLSTLNNLVRISIKNIMNGVNTLMLNGTRKTISAREIQSSVRLMLPIELSRHAVTEGTKATTKYCNMKLERKEEAKKAKSKGEKLHPISRASMAGLLFPVTRIENMMMELSTVARKTDTAAVYLAAVLEYLTAELVELSGNTARDNKKTRISPRHIMSSIRTDSELNKYYGNTVLSGGVLPQIHSFLTKKESRKSPTKKTTPIKKSSSPKKKTKKTKKNK